MPHDVTVLFFKLGQSIGDLRRDDCRQLLGECFDILRDVGDNPGVDSLCFERGFLTVRDQKIMGICADQFEIDGVIFGHDTKKNAIQELLGKPDVSRVAGPTNELSKWEEVYVLRGDGKAKFIESISLEVEWWYYRTLDLVLAFKQWDTFLDQKTDDPCIHVCLLGDIDFEVVGSDGSARTIKNCPRS